jgi:hypothetical protein
MSNQYRQGDLLLVQVSALPDQAEVLSHRIVLQTGPGAHQHQLNSGALVQKAETLFVHLVEDGALVHDEHAQVLLPRGDYQVVRQREYVPGPASRPEPQGNYKTPVRGSFRGAFD